MTIKDFAIERYFARHEFTAKYLLSSSDCDGFAMDYVLNLASDEEKNLVFDEKHKLPSIADLYENGVALWGMAKSFGLGGLRIGWLASQNGKILLKVESFKDYLSICNSATSEILSTIALNNSAHFIQPNMQKIKQNIIIFKQFAKRNEHFLDFPIPNSGSTAFVKLKIKEKAMDFAERLVQDTGIMLLPSETFEYGTKHARIGFGRANLAEILGVFEKYINQP